MGPNFPEPCPVPRWSRSVCAKGSGQELPAGTHRQSTGKHSDLTTARALRGLWIKSCRDDDFHYNINQTKVRTLARPPHFQCTSGRTIKGGLVSAYSLLLLLRLPAWITVQATWCWLTTVLWEPGQEHCDLQNLLLQMGDFGFSLGL